MLTISSARVRTVTEMDRGIGEIGEEIYMTFNL
jgi:hypothetical protein